MQTALHVVIGPCRDTPSAVLLLFGRDVNISGANGNSLNSEPQTQQVPATVSSPTSNGQGTSNSSLTSSVGPKPAVEWAESRIIHLDDNQFGMLISPSEKLGPNRVTLHDPILRDAFSQKTKKKLASTKKKKNKMQKENRHRRNTTALRGKQQPQRKRQIQPQTETICSGENNASASSTVSCSQLEVQPISQQSSQSSDERDTTQNFVAHIQQRLQTLAGEKPTLFEGSILDKRCTQGLDFFKVPPSMENSSEINMEASIAKRGRWEYVDDHDAFSSTESEEENEIGNEQQNSNRPTGCGNSNSEEDKYEIEELKRVHST
jgi:hypothetical protein